jgi:hypothetical protein
MVLILLMAFQHRETETPIRPSSDHVPGIVRSYRQTHQNRVLVRLNATRKAAYRGPVQSGGSTEKFHSSSMG